MAVNILEIRRRREKYAKHFRTRDGKQIAEIHAGTVLTYGQDGKRENVDMRLKRFAGEAFDGWQIVDADWHYRIGRFGDQDGWIGFGGRAGKSWFNFRLAAMAWLHEPTGAIDVIHTAAYDRDQLTSKARPLQILNGFESIFATGEVSWAGVMPAVDAIWRVEGAGVKEDIILRGGVEALPELRNTRASDTQLTMLFEIDTSKIELSVDGRKISLRDTVDLEDRRIDLLDDQEQLIAFLPFDTVTSAARTRRGRSAENVDFVGLKKRIIQHEGKTYLAVGATLEDLRKLPSGDLIFDPTITVSSATGTGQTSWHEWGRPNQVFGLGDGMHVNDAPLSGTYGRRNAFLQFDLSSIPTGSVVSGAQLTLTNYYNGAGKAQTKIYPMLFAWDAAYLNWYKYDDGQTWPGSPGALTAGEDFDNTTTVASFTGPSSAYQKVTVNLDSAYIQKIIGSSPEHHNHGWTLRASDGYNNYYGRNASVADRRPVLTITYEEQLQTAVSIGMGAHTTARVASAGVNFATATINVVDLPPIPITALGNLFWQTRSSTFSVLLLMPSGSDWCATDTTNVLTYGLRVRRREAHLLTK